MQQTPPLYRLPGVMYAKDAPVVISSGELLPDNQNGRFLVRLVFENLTDKVITAAKIRIASLDPADRPTGDAMEFYYLDLNVPRGGQFGGDRYLALSHPATRGFSYKILEVIFADKTVWAGANAFWEPLPARTTLDEALQEPELVKQYRLRYGQSCRYVPLVLPELHLCSCGTINKGKEACRNCGLRPTLLSTELLDSLRADADIRLEREAAQRAEQQKLLARQQEEQRRLWEEQQRLAEEQRKLQEEENARKAEERRKAMAEYGGKLKKTGKKALKITLWTAAGLALALVLYVVSVLWIVPEVRYQNALKALDKEDYQEAHRLFTLLQDYKDSEEYLSRFRVVAVNYQYTRDCSDLDPDSEYTTAGMLEANSEGYTTEYTYDQQGNRTRSKRTNLVLKNGKFVPEGEPEIDEEFTAYQYSINGKPLKVTEIDGNYTVYSYNGDGWLAREEDFDPEGTATGDYITYTYSGDRLIKEESVTPTESIVTTYIYDSNGKLTKQVEATTYFEVPEKNSYYKPSDSHTWTYTYEYDRGGRLTEVKGKSEYPADPDRNSKTTEKYTYDLAGRLTSSEYESDYTEEKATYTYNWRGDLTEYKYDCEHHDADGEVFSEESNSCTITYNALGHLKEEKVSIKSSYCGEERSQKITIEYKCRLNGSVKESTVTSKGDAPGANYKQVIEFDENGQAIRQKKTYKNGIVDEYEWEYAYYYDPDIVPETVPYPSEPIRNVPGYTYFRF